MSDQIRYLSAETLEQFIGRLYAGAGLPEQDAGFHARALVEASLRGVDSHGVLRTKAYFDRLRSGAINRTPAIRQVEGEKAFVVLDADAASGFTAAKYAMERAISLAAEYQVGVVAVRNSNHFGAAALYAMMALEAGMAGFATTNVKPLMTAPGARGNVVGNNPFAVAVPTGAGSPFVLDLSLSVVAGGKLKLAAKKNERIPLGWATDIDGNPTDDPRKGFDGYLLPVGGFKGLGIAYAIDILCGLVSGGAFSHRIKSMYGDPEDPSGTCHLFLALNLPGVIGEQQLYERMAEYRSYIGGIPTAQGGEPLCFPGELEERRRQERLREGIPVPAAVYEELCGCAEEIGLSTGLLGTQD